MCVGLPVLGRSPSSSFPLCLFFSLPSTSCSNCITTEQSNYLEPITMTTTLISPWLNGTVCLEEENQEKIQEMVRIYKKGPISLDPNFITLRCKIGSGFFGDVFLATIPLRNSNRTKNTDVVNVSSSSANESVKSASSSSSSSSQSTNVNSNSSSSITNNSTCNYIQVAVKLLRDSSLFNSKVSCY